MTQCKPTFGPLCICHISFFHISPNNLRSCGVEINIFEGGFWARGLEYELIDDFCYTLIVIRTLGHILRQILVAKIHIGHWGESNPSDLESDTLAPYQKA